jgi:flagella basal body P-ring formation protein FlgA
LERRSFQDREAIGSPADVVGYKVIQVVRRGQALTNAVVRSAEAVALDEIVVKKRTLVRLVARRRNLTVTIPQAEALDDGRVGDTIRVRNPQSDRVVSGKVVDSGTVNVSL